MSVIIASARADAVVVNLDHSWAASSADGWRLEDAAAPPGESGDRTDWLVFDEGSAGWSPISSDPPNVVRYWLEAGSEAFAGAFHGNYFDAGVAFLRFDFYAAHPCKLVVELRREADWVIYEAVLDISGGWQRIELPLTDAHFSLEPFSAPIPLRDLLADVTQLAFGVRPGAMPEAQLFRIKQISLRGSGPGYGSWIAPHEALHGGEANSWLPGADRSGNGIMNADAFTAGLDPADASDLFTINGWAQQPPQLTWLSRTGRVYSVWRSHDLSEDFTPVEGYEDIVGTGDIKEVTLPSDEGLGPWFYRLHVERAAPHH